MKAKDVCKSLLLKKTWVRVDEITRRGYFRNNEKKVLFKRPIPKEDVLPMAISNFIVFSMLIIIVIMALNIFPLIVKIILGIMLLILIFLPAYLARVYFKDR